MGLSGPPRNPDAQLFAGELTSEYLPLAHTGHQASKIQAATKKGKQGKKSKATRKPPVITPPPCMSPPPCFTPPPCTMKITIRRRPADGKITIKKGTR